MTEKLSFSHIDASIAKKLHERNVKQDPYGLQERNVNVVEYIATQLNITTEQLKALNDVHLDRIAFRVKEDEYILGLRRMLENKAKNQQEEYAALIDAFSYVKKEPK